MVVVRHSRNRSEAWASTTISAFQSASSEKIEEESTTSTTTATPTSVLGQDLLSGLRFNAYSYTSSELKGIAVQLLTESHVLAEFGVEKAELEAMVSEISGLYQRTVPYHNWTHAVDVLQATVLLARTLNDGTLSRCDEAILALAALGHDLDHPGLDNSFHSQAGTYLAKTHQQSTLEEHHSEIMCTVLTRSIFSELSEDVRSNALSQVRSIILATDMARHKPILETAREAFVDHDQQGGTHDKSLILRRVIIKIADMVNVLRPVNVSYHAACRLREEMFRQGDRERELGFTPLPFRNRFLDNQSNLPKWQVGFIDLVLSGMMKAIAQVFPALACFQEIIDEKRTTWESLAHQEDPEGSGMFPLLGALKPTNILQNKFHTGSRFAPIKAVRQGTC